jgi:GT2 family glycosyltransferase
MPRISVIIPTCARLEHLAGCLESLAPSRQGVSEEEVEFLVTDDGRTKTAETLVRSDFPWARWTRGPARGPAANRNHAARLATGEWLAFIDDDCVAGAGWLQAILARAGRAELEVIEGRTEMPVDVEHPFTHGVENLNGGVFWSCNLAVRRERFLALGGFDEEFLEPFGEDMEFAWRMRRAGCMAVFVPEALVIHPPRHHGWRGFFARAPMLRWSLLYFQKTGAAPGPDASPLLIARTVIRRHLYTLAKVVRDIFRRNPRGTFALGLLNAFANWLIAPFQLPYLLWWEFKFRRRAARQQVK